MQFMRTMDNDKDNIMPASIAKANECKGYLNAIVQSTRLLDDAGKRVLPACIDGKTTLPEIVHAFIGYAYKNSQLLRQPAMMVAYAAMGAAFPCKKADQ